MKMVDVTTSVTGRFGVVVALVDSILVVVADIEDFAASSTIAIVFVVRLGAGLGLVDLRPAGPVAGSRISVVVQLLLGQTQFVDQLKDFSTG